MTFWEFPPSPQGRNGPGDDGAGPWVKSLKLHVHNRREPTQDAARSPLSQRLQAVFLCGLTRFNIKLATRGNSQLLSVLYMLDGFSHTCLHLILYPSCSGWGGGVEPRVLCMLGKPSIPELHHEFLRALAFSGACLPSCVRKHGMGECLGLGSHEV